MRDIELEYGLRVVARADRTAARNPSRAEMEKAARSEPEFFAALDRRGVRVRLRHSEHTPGEVTGYAVTMDGAVTAAGEPVWFGGGKLAPDLTLPKLRRRWRARRPGAPRVRRHVRRPRGE
jgi:hypothetical protein